MTTLKFIQDNRELTDDGYRYAESLSALCDEAVEYDYRTDDGESLVTAFEVFEKLLYPEPPRVFDGKNRSKFHVVKEAVLTLLCPRGNLANWEMGEIKEALRADLTKDQIIEAFIIFATAANEYFRLRWLIAEHGGWRKEADDGKHE